jgi:hypothetical protein
MNRSLQDKKLGDTFQEEEPARRIPISCRISFSGNSTQMG